MTCYDAGDCMSFSFDGKRSECHHYIGRELVDAKSKSDICPKGVGKGYEELPGYPLRPGHYGQEYGPCLGRMTGVGKDMGLDHQGDSTGDQQIFNLPREETQPVDEEAFELR